MRKTITHIIIILAFCSCSKEDADIDIPITGDPISIGLETRAGLPAGNYGLYATAYNNGQSFSWTVPYSSILLFNNISVDVDGSDKLDFGPPPILTPHIYRYPITDTLSVFLYHPYNGITPATPTSIPIERVEAYDTSPPNDLISDKYPDYLGGDVDVSVIGGTPEGQIEPNIELKHLMSRIRFRVSNSAPDAFTIDNATLIGIKWEGTINPYASNTSSDPVYTPTSVSAEDLSVFENFTVPGLLLTPKNINIKDLYIYDESEKGVYDNDHLYHILLPPLNETQLNNVALKIEYTRYGHSYTDVPPIPLRRLIIEHWDPGKSYCYTIQIESFKIDFIEAIIEEWKEEVYVDSITFE